MTATYKNLYINQGETYRQSIDLPDAFLTLDLSEFSARCFLRETTDNETYYTLDTALINDSNGIVIELHLSSEDSSAIPAKRYLYDVEIFAAINTENVVYRVFEGIATVKPEITHLNTVA